MKRVILVCSAAAVLLSGSCGREIRRPVALPIDVHLIYAEVRPDSSFLSCQDVLTVALDRHAAGWFFFLLNQALSVDKIQAGGRGVPFTTLAAPRLEDYVGELDDEDRDFYANASAVVLQLPAGGESVPEEGPRTLVVSYSGVIYDSLRVPDYSRGTEAEQTRGLIDTAGTFLSPATHWYPRALDRMAVFNITAVTPEGYEAVTQGRLSSREVAGGEVTAVWRATHPAEEAYLIAGPYDISTIQHAGVELSTYFYESESDLCQQYLQASARYIDMYNELLGPYPYAKFAVVENFFPTGYGMPSYTLLGRRVLRLPFIVHTSLGHEIAHNWWGNGVLVDPDGGNWCEGLTTYCADYRYKLLMGEENAREYRRNINRDFTAYVTSENDMPLSEFSERTTRASRAIGYGKCAMVFHMLEQITGQDVFVETLKSIISKHMFKQVGWSEIEKEFSNAHGEDLGWFFSQWVRGTGAPLVKIAGATRSDRWPGYTLAITLEQEGGPFRMNVPVMVRTEGGRFWKTVDMDGSVARVKVNCKTRPISVDVDPDHHLMRRMAQSEIAPTLAMVLGDDKTIVVTPGGASPEAAAAYEALATQLSRTGEAQVVADVDLAASQIDSNSLFILGGAGENSALDAFEGKWPKTVFSRPGAFKVKNTTYSSSEDCALFVGRNPANSDKTIAILGGLSAKAVQACSRRVIHYGTYGYVVFKAGQAVDKGTWTVRDYPRRVVSRGLVG